MIQFSIRQSALDTALQVERITASTGIGTLAASLLIRRGIDSVERAKAFLKADEFYDPFLLDGMQQATETIKQAMREKWPITVYGDYDCDGTCACAILHTAFAQAGTSAQVYIPDRRIEGYGLNENAIREIAKRGGLLITVDCGITNLKEVDLANDLGLKVIVSDHHLPLRSMPACICINPPKDRNYPCSFLCGAGIALKLVHALFGEKIMLPLTDFAAIATVADLVPLLDENRAIVKTGLRKIEENARPGLLALIKACGYGNNPLTAGQIAFGIGPRINAAGRMGHAKRALDLFTAKDPAEAERLALELDRENQLRQQQEQRILTEANGLLAGEIYNKRTAVVASAGWHQGVIGIVASRLVEIYGRPSAVISILKDGICTGSARGIPGVNIFAALDDCSAFLLRYGGHEHAGGFSLPQENLPDFLEAFENHFRTRYSSSVWMRRVECDLDVQPEQMTLALAKDLEQLAPYGVGNPTPLLLMTQTRLTGKAKMGKTDDHLRLALEKGGRRTEGLLFRAKQFDVPRTMSVCDFVGTLDSDSYGGTQRARYLIRAMRLNRVSIVDLAQQAGGLFGYGFAKCCVRMSDPMTLEQADEHMQSTPYGLRLDVHTPQTLKKILAHWHDDESMALLDPYLVSVQDSVHGRNALVIAPDSTKSYYPMAYRLDCDDAIRSYAAAIFTERDMMAKIYRQLIIAAHRPMEINDRCRRTANVAGVLPDCVGAAAAVFEELGFFTLEPMTLRPQDIAEKRELASSDIYRELMHLARGEQHGA